MSEVGQKISILSSAPAGTINNNNKKTITFLTTTNRRASIKSEVLIGKQEVSTKTNVQSSTPLFYIKMEQNDSEMEHYSDSDVIASVNAPHRQNNFIDKKIISDFLDKQQLQTRLIKKCDGNSIGISVNDDDNHATNQNELTRQIEIGDECDDDYCDDDDDLDDEEEDDDDADSIFGEEYDDINLPTEQRDDEDDDNKKPFIHLQTINVKSFKQTSKAPQVSVATSIHFKKEPIVEEEEVADPNDPDYYVNQNEKFEESDEDYIYPGSAKKASKSKKKKKIGKKTIKNESGITNTNTIKKAKQRIGQFKKEVPEDIVQVKCGKGFRQKDQSSTKRDVGVQCQVYKLDPVLGDFIHELHTMNDLFRYEAQAYLRLSNRGRRHHTGRQPPSPEEDVYNTNSSKTIKRTRIEPTAAAADRLRVVKKLRTQDDTVEIEVCNDAAG